MQTNPFPRLLGRGPAKMVRIPFINGEFTGWPKVIIPAGISVLIGALLFSSTGHDDSHITYWAADILSRCGEIINYNGERVEQSSSLAHVVLLAILAKTSGLSTVTIGGFVCILFGAATVIITQNLASVVNPRIS